MWIFSSWSIASCISSRILEISTSLDAIHSLSSFICSRSKWFSVFLTDVSLWRCSTMLLARSKSFCSSANIVSFSPIISFRARHSLCNSSISEQLFSSSVILFRYCFNWSSFSEITWSFSFITSSSCWTCTMKLLSKALVLFWLTEDSLKVLFAPTPLFSLSDNIPFNCSHCWRSSSTSPDVFCIS